MDKNIELGDIFLILFDFWNRVKFFLILHFVFNGT